MSFFSNTPPELLSFISIPSCNPSLFHTTSTCKSVITRIRQDYTTVLIGKKKDHPESAKVQRKANEETQQISCHQEVVPFLERHCGRYPTRTEINTCFQKSCKETAKRKIFPYCTNKKSSMRKGSGDFTFPETK